MIDSQILAIGLTASFTTSMDELLVLMVLFAEVAAEPNGAMKAKHVITGLNLGFSILVAISLSGVLVGLMVPGKYLGLMGFAPILIGAKKLFGVCIKAVRSKKKPDSQSVQGEASGALENGEAAHEEEEAKEPLPPITPLSRAGSLCRQTELEVTRIENPVGKVGEAPAAVTWWARIRALLRNTLTLCHPSTLRVAAIIVGDGGDTLSVYLPLFATLMHTRHRSSQGPLGVATLLVIAYTVLAMWCVVAQLLVKMPVLKTLVAKWGRYLVPLLLITIGVYVLFDSEAHLLMRP